MKDDEKYLKIKKANLHTQIKAMRKRMGSESHWVIYITKIFKSFYSLTQECKHSAYRQLPYQELRIYGDTLLRQN